MDERALFSRVPRSNNPDCRSGALLLPKSHRGRNPAMWLDSVNSKL